MKDYELVRRIDILERKFALMEGKEDPGITCWGEGRNQCSNGKTTAVLHPEFVGMKEWEYGNWHIVPCPVCKGTGRIYPEIEAGFKIRLGDSSNPCGKLTGESISTISDLSENKPEKSWRDRSPLF